MSLALKLMEDGGPIMWVILFCSVIALFIFLKKVFQFHREEINVGEVLRGLFNVLRRDGFVEALTLCDHTPGPAARLLAAAIRAYERGDEDIRKAMDDAALEEIPKLERHINLLSTLGFVLPLIGFLGTVLGMMQVFEAAQGSEAFSATDIAGAVNMALISTAAALSVAIPCYLAYNYLVARVNSITLDMEKSSLEMLGFIERRRKNAGGSQEETQK
ncbi:MAG: MotA/TolQ/ExbB proton channel family protein [Victivallales bacterium]|jgi:biopolymer transport protein ExbB|nr:MotA/TolQ/ExbB proton channel family protein [Victivallales bacterium]